MPEDNKPVMGNEKPTGDPSDNPPSDSDGRDAYIERLKQENISLRLKVKETNSKVSETTGVMALRETAAQERERLAQDKVLLASVKAEAALAGFRDPADAWNMLDRAAVKLGEDWTVEGLAEALQKLAEAKPYLLKDSAPPADRPDVLPAKPQPKPKPPSPGIPGSELRLTKEDLAKMPPEDFARQWADPVFRNAVAEANKE
jgi:hypothetical protein